MCENPNDKSFEFQFRKGHPPSPQGKEPTCDICHGKIDLGTPESYHKVYWQAYLMDIYTHIACF